MSIVSLQPVLASLLNLLSPRPIKQAKLNELVQNTITESKAKTSADNRKSQWEYLLKNQIFLLAETEGKALKDEETTYYDELKDMLDLILTFTEHDACEQTFPFVVLQDLLETQTITSCSHVFSWIEARAARLTDGMVPQKGKALILLRTLNDLLRRLSKMGTTTIFCGRILTFLSGVFPLGERSGVNLRGEYGPTWEGVKDTSRKEPEEKNDVIKVETMDATQQAKDSVDSQDNQMDVDSKDTKNAATDPKTSEQKEDFYNTFWSLQLPFSKPPLFATTETFPQFKDAVNKVLPVIKEATAKERAMMGSRAGAGAASLKRKRDPESEEVNVNDYFFAKFLTSADLIDLEIADTHFRRQFLFQLLILLNHLLMFTKSAKATWSSARNRSLQMDFLLETEDAQWVQEMTTKAMEELRQTTPNGRAFAETVSVILEREKNWVRWKNELCAPFDKEPWSTELDEKKVGLLEATKAVRARMREPPADWEWKLGTEPLTEIWDMGCRGLDDLQNPFQPGDVKDFVKKIKQEDARIDLRKKNLAKAAERIKLAREKAAASVTPAPTPEKETVPFPSKPSEPPVPASSDAPTLSTPRPTTTPAGSSPLHPSLPAKPGSSPIKPSPSQDSVKMTSPTTTQPPPVVVVAPPTPLPAPTPAPVPVPAPVEATPPPTDEQLLKFEENKNRWAWLALRTARDQHLQHFGKIGTGDIELLAKEIEAEKEKMQKSEETVGQAGATGTADETMGTGSPPITTVAEPHGTEDMQSIEPTRKTDGEGDVRMEES